MTVTRLPLPKRHVKETYPRYEQKPLGLKKRVLAFFGFNRTPVRHLCKELPRGPIQKKEYIAWTFDKGFVPKPAIERKLDLEHE